MEKENMYIQKGRALDQPLQNMFAFKIFPLYTIPIVIKKMERILERKRILTSEVSIVFLAPVVIRFSSMLHQDV
jgi:hypothetical protein